MNIQWIHHNLVAGFLNPRILKYICRFRRMAGSCRHLQVQSTEAFLSTWMPSVRGELRNSDVTGSCLINVIPTDDSAVSSAPLVLPRTSPTTSPLHNHSLALNSYPPIPLYSLTHRYHIRKKVNYIFTLWNSKYMSRNACIDQNSMKKYQ